MSLHIYVTAQPVTRPKAQDGEEQGRLDATLIGEKGVNGNHHEP